MWSIRQHLLSRNKARSSFNAARLRSAGPRRCFRDWFNVTMHCSFKPLPRRLSNVAVPAPAVQCARGTFVNFEDVRVLASATPT